MYVLREIDEAYHVVLAVRMEGGSGTECSDIYICTGPILPLRYGTYYAWLAASHLDCCRRGRERRCGDLSEGSVNRGYRRKGLALDLDLQGSEVD